MVLSLRKRAVPFAVGKPVAAHVAADAIQERTDSRSHGVSPSCFSMLSMVKKTLIQAKLEPVPKTGFSAVHGVQDVVRRSAAVVADSSIDYAGSAEDYREWNAARPCSG